MGREIVLRVLGPVRVRAGGAWLAPATPQLRLVAGLMALRIGQVVPVDELVDTIWDTHPPRSARASLQSLVTRLRQLLTQTPGAELPRCGDGYQLMLEHDLVDAHRFRALGRSARETEGPDAIPLFDAAMALWNGPVLADAADTARVRTIRHGMAEERLSMLQDRLACMLACGQERAAAAELPVALARYPLNERLAGMLMATQYWAGQRADALEEFRRIRGRLATELGVEPGPELQRLHQRILAGDTGVAGPVRPGGATGPVTPPEPGGPWQQPERPASPERDGEATALIARPVPRQLPAAPAQFVGRTTELGALDEMVGLAGTPGGEAVIGVIVGSPGIGKSALATVWAHRAARYFPGGQLYVNLKGFSPAGRPATPEQAICGFLQALGVPSAGLPESLDEQAALYRSILAGQRVLVLLDNARDAEQVHALLPGSSGCAVLVTSRARLDGLVATVGARVLTLDVMSQAESRELIARRLGTSRVRAEPTAVAELARLCGGLPLGLTVAAARAVTRPGFRLAALSAELGSGQARLDALETADTASSVREVFSWSYRQLSEPAARMFRLLSLPPGPDISVAAAASLGGIARREARRALAELTSAHLVTEHLPGRFTGHDLLRAYAAEQAMTAEGETERDAATRRLTDHYLHTAAAASQRLCASRDALNLSPPQPGTAPEQLAAHSDALAWFGAEHQVLLAITDAAAAAGWDSCAWQLAAALTEYLDREGRWHDLTEVARTALAAAERSSDSDGRAHAHSSLGLACLRAGRYDAARSHLLRALDLFGETGATAWQARCRLGLGALLDQQGRHGEARAQAEQALRLYRELGHRAGEAHALENLGWHLALLGDYPDAGACCRRALGLLRETGNPLGEACAWDTLGYVQHQLGEDAAAMACYQRALDLLEETTDRSAQGTVLAHLGDTYRAVGDQAMARTAWQQALDIFDELHDVGADEVRSKLAEQPRTALPSVS
jgi:DNA-binding SARP family transcriptional activator/tetratricopeptide (TPR) repeat protein